MTTQTPQPHGKDIVRVRCGRCGREGRYFVQRFHEIAGTANRPDALLAFARARGCEVARRQASAQMHDRCGIEYVIGDG